MMNIALLHDLLQHVVSNRHKHAGILGTFVKQRIVTITYLLTPWSRVLLEKLTGSAASQEIPRIFGT